MADGKDYSCAHKQAIRESSINLNNQAPTSNQVKIEVLITHQPRIRHLAQTIVECISDDKTD